MGRRSSELKPVDEILVEILSGSERGMTFTEIVAQARRRARPISRATVARTLSKLIRKGIVKKEFFIGKRAFYKLTVEAIDKKHVQRSLFSILSMHLFNEILEGASAGKLSDEEFTRLFTSRIGTLAMYTLLQGLSTSKLDPEEAGKWIEEAFGTLIQKDGWRVCLNRQIFGKPVPLRHRITLKQPVVPEITIEEGTIYVRMPSAIEPGLAARVLRELPPIPEERLEGLIASLRKLYPKETGLLDNVLNQIEEAARISKMEVKK